MKKALIIGVTQYGKNLYQPQFALEDAKAIAQLLEILGSFNQIQVLLDGVDPADGKKYEPQDIENLILQLFQPQKRNIETALLFFSGNGSGIYGTESQPTQNGDLLLTDFPESLITHSSESVSQLKTRSIALKWLHSLLENSPVKQQLVWLDSDFSYCFIDLFSQSSSSRQRCFIAAKHDSSGYVGETSTHGILTDALLKILNPVKETEITSHTIIDQLTNTFNWPKNCSINIGDLIVLKRINVRPQKLWNDLAEGKDLLHIQNEANALAEMLLLRDLDPPLAVGIMGDWGSGKSYIMNLMQQRMLEIRSSFVPKGQGWETNENSSENTAAKLYPYVGHIYQIKFDAWTYAQSNLWVSLMHTIFFELEQQITLELKLQALFESLNIDPYQENSGYVEIWKVLYKTSEEERNYFLDKVLTKDNLEKLKSIKIPQDEKVAQLLWNKYAEAEVSVLDILKNKQQELTNITSKIEEKQEELKEAKKELTQTEADANGKSNADVKQIIGDVLGISGMMLKKQLGEEEFTQIKKKIEQEINHPDFKVDLDDLGTLILKIRELWINFRKKNNNDFKFLYSTISKWFDTNKIFVIIFLLVALTSLVLPLIVAHLKPEAIIAQVISFISPLLVAIGFAKNLWESVRKYYIQTKKALQDYGREVEARLEQRMQMIERERNETIDRIETELTRLKKEKKQKEIEIEQTKQELPKNFAVSLKDFIDNALQQYDKQLGLMYQIKNHLMALSHRLLLPSDPSVTSEEYKSKRDVLKQVFPRGLPRVVLFIDDLDRCPPNQVVKVLEAVQLLIKTPLFIAVLAIDERYITRALEKHYQGILIRKGQPSATDYLEKIIQIPYRVRPIVHSALKDYLGAQMEIVSEKKKDANSSEEISPNKSQNEIVETSQNTGSESPDSTPKVSANDMTLETLKFTRQEVDLLEQCCRYINLSPRMIKRLVNIYKIFKISEFHTNKIGQTNDNKTKDILSFLSLSARYPNFIRELVENLEIQFEEIERLNQSIENLKELKKKDPTISDTEITKAESKQKELTGKKMLEFFQELTLNNDDYLKRESKRFMIDATALLREATLAEFDLETFNLIRSFCFFGDIGYSPEDSQNERYRF